MKMYVKSAAVNVALPDALDAVIFVADIASEGISDVFASESSYDEYGNSYSKMSDEELVSLGKDAIQYIEDLPTLVRVGKLDDSLLSLEQRKKIQEYESQKFTSDRLTVQQLLRLIDSCDSAEFMSSRSQFKKNKELNREFPNLDKIAVLKSLTVADYCETGIGGDTDTFCDDLFVFTKTVEAGDPPKNVEIYIKIDRDWTDETTVALVSFHKVESGSVEDKPYSISDRSK